MSDIESVPWSQFLNRFVWNQGEHVAVMAPTGAGKTTLIRALLPRRKYICFFGTKREDKQYTGLIREDGFRRVENFADIQNWMRKVLLWPRHAKQISVTTARQQARFRTAFDGIADQGGWTVVADEAKYMAEMLGLGKQLTFLMEQLRSTHGTVISGAQRPFWLPRSILSNSTHVFLWKTTDSDDLKRLADIGGVNRRQVANELATLGKHEFLYVYTRGTEAKLMRSQVSR